MNRKMFDWKGGERGSIIPIVAVGMVTLFGFMGLSIDVGNVLVAQSQLRNAADAAAVAGAAGLSDPGPTGSIALPNFSGASARTQDALQKLGNISAGTPVLVANIVPGGWSMTAQAFDATIPLKPGFAPVIKVTVTKNEVANAQGKKNGFVPSYFAKIFNIQQFSPTATAIAMGDYSPSTAAAGQLFPFVLTECSYSKLWDTAKQAPKNPGFTIQLDDTYGQGQVSGCPYITDWLTITDSSGKCPIGAPDIVNILPPPEGTASPKTTVGDPICETNGVKATIYDHINNFPMPYGGFIPVVSSVVPGTTQPVTTFACIEITSVNKTGSTKYVRFKMLPVSDQPVPGVKNPGGFTCKLKGSGATVGSPYVTAPPLLVN